MTTLSQRPRQNDRKVGTIRQLRGGRKHAINCYPHAYKCQQKQVPELIHDLAAESLDIYEEDNEHGTVARYGPYFLDSITLQDEADKKIVIANVDREAHQGLHQSLAEPIWRLEWLAQEAHL